MQDFPDQRCPIWSIPAQTGRYRAFILDVDSARAGGAYSIDMLAWRRLPPDDLEVRAKLTTWLIDERRAGVEWPMVTADVIAFVDARPALKLSERIDRFFLYLSRSRYRPGSSIDLTDDAVRHRLAAWTESETDDEFLALRNLMIHARLIEGGIPHDIMLTPGGYERLEAVEQHSVASRQAFVAMWFGAEMQAAYDDGFAPGLADAGYAAFRIDRKEHANKIDDEIVAEIRRSRFVVADFTCPLLHGEDGTRTANARGGVYYEAGFAQGLGMPVIWTVRADCIDHVHFDTRQFAHIVWTEPADLRLSLTNRVRAVIGAGRQT